MALPIGDIIALARAGYKLHDIQQMSEAEKESEKESEKEPEKELVDLRAENKRLMEQIAKMQKDNVDSDVHKQEQTDSLADIIRTYM